MHIVLIIKELDSLSQVEKDINTEIEKKKELAIKYYNKTINEINADAPRDAKLITKHERTMKHLLALPHNIKVRLCNLMIHKTNAMFKRYDRLLGSSYASGHTSRLKFSKNSSEKALDRFINYTIPKPESTENKIIREKNNYENDISNVDTEILINISDKINENTINSIKELLLSLKSRKIKTDLILQTKQTVSKISDGIPYQYSRTEFELLEGLQISIEEDDLTIDNKLFFRDYVTAEKIPFEEVKTANEFIHKMADYIKSKNLTPFETVLFIHNFCGKFKYNEPKNSSKFLSVLSSNMLADKSRALPNVFSTGNIVCVGYASIFKSICDELNMPGLSVKLNSCFIKKKNESLITAGHANNIVSITDEAYNITGEYVEDSCWDSDTGNGVTYITCLYPLTDMTKLYKYQFLQLGEDEKVSDYYTFVTYTDKQTRKTKRLYNNMLLQKTLDYIKDHPVSSPISLDTFEKGLFYYQIKIGNHEKLAKEQTEIFLRKSRELADKTFKKDATNVFTVNAISLQSQDSSHTPGQTQIEKKQDNLEHFNNYYNLVNTQASDPRLGSQDNSNTNRNNTQNNLKAFDNYNAIVK